MKKINSFIKKSLLTLDSYFNYYIWKTKKVSLSNTILVSGAPRTGTTWVTDILSTLDNYRVIFEPFRWNCYLSFQRVNIYPHRPYVPYYKPHDKLKNYLEKVFTGRVKYLSLFNIELSARFFINNIVGNKVLVKFIRANRLIPWIDNNFNIRSIYLVIRHPGASIASQLRYRLTGYHRLGRRFLLDKKVILNEAKQIVELRDNPELYNFLKRLDDKIEILAAIWALDYYVPFYHIKGKDWYLVFYERLLLDWEDEIKKMFSHLNEVVPSKVEKYRYKPSVTTFEKKKVINVGYQLKKWKNLLTKRQINSILRVTHKFGFDFYTEKLTPIYDVLK